MAFRCCGGPKHERDAVAQLLLAGLLSFDRRDAEAITIYDAVAKLGGDHLHAGLLGKANSLMALGRAEEALVLFDRVSIERSELSEAIEGRARALRQLGRHAEAEKAFQQYIARVERQSDLRVRASRGIRSGV